ncbi:MAG: hypothetical protein GF408_08480 [Candidatus Omnitrophica bacterium]|nr:hypothetical protein [Candidatus Omnitrophota bacterium]
MKGSFKRKRIAVLLIGAVFCACAAGCGGKDPGDEVIASVGNTRITVNDFNERVSNLPPRYQRIAKARKGQFLQELITDILLYNAALEKGVDKDREVRKMVEEAKKKILIARLLKDEVNEAVTITDEEVEEYYLSNPVRYMTPEILRASHILLLNKDDAEEAVRALDAGVPFEEVARAKSVDPTAQNGGDIGYFPRGQLMPEFEKACAGLEVGQVSGIVRTSLGYHIIKLTDRRDPVLRPLEQVEDSIRARIAARKRSEAFSSLLAELKRDTEVKINEEALSMDPEKEK